MRRPLFTLALLGTLCAGIAGHAPALAQATAVEGARVIVKFSDDDAPTARRQILAAHEHRAAQAQALGARVGLALRSGQALDERTQVLMASGIDSAALAERLRQAPGVEYAVVDHRRRAFAAPNDPYYLSGPLNGIGAPAVGQWYLRTPDATLRSAIGVEAAWKLTPGDPSIVVAVLDTGVRFDHADLLPVAQGGNLLPGYDFVSNDFIGNDGQPGRDADASDPGDIVTEADITHPSNTIGCTFGEVTSRSSWHGTETAGLVGATTNNGIGIAGVGRSVRVLPLRVLGRCGGYDSDIIAAMRWAVGLVVDGVPANPTPARVINLSLGGGGACTTAYTDVVQTVNALGAVVVASAGNSVGHAVSVPANCPGVIGVAGLRHAGTKVGFSDLGPEISIAAPGGNCVNLGGSEPCLYPIVTTTNAGLTTPVAASSVYSDSFNASFGTSFSAPLVSGVAGLMLSANPALTPAELLSAMKTSARAFPTTGAETGSEVIPQCTAPQGANPADQLQCYCNTATCGAGMLDAGGATQAALAVPAPSVLPRITVSPTAPNPGDTVHLSAQASVVPPGRTIVSYLWQVVDGGQIVTGFSSAADGSTVTAVPSAGGHFNVRLSVVDDQARTTATVLSVAVAGPGPQTGSGGGGALGFGWLLGLAAAVAALHLTARRNGAA